MKIIGKQILAGLALCGFAHAALGYNFTFKNTTDKAVSVKLNLVASLADYDDMTVIQPGTSHKFNFTGFKSGFCLSQVSFGTTRKQSLMQTYPMFVEAEKYVTVEASKYSMNVCKSLTFDIMDVPGVGLTLQKRD
jgi:hypothetical protein